MPELVAPSVNRASDAGAAPLEAKASLEVPGSIGQRLLWLLDHYRGSDGALNCPVLFRVRGSLSTERLFDALGRVFLRHEALRTVFEFRRGALVQKVRSEFPGQIRHVRLNGEAEEEQLEAELAKELRSRVDPVRHSVRVTLWTLSCGDQVVCINAHHLVTDAWSCSVIFNDLVHALSSENSEECTEGEAPFWQYRDFCEQEQKFLQSEQQARANSYWRNQLRGMSLPAIPLAPSDGGRDRNVLRVTQRIPPEVLKEIASLSQELNTSPFAVCLTAYFLTLYATTTQTDLSVASLLANRDKAEARRAVGFFANMAVLRTRLRPFSSVAEAIRDVHRSVMGAIASQALPYQLLPGDVLPQEPGRRMDDVVFQMMAEPVSSVQVGDASLDVLVPDGVGGRFELELVLVPQNEGLCAILFFNQARLEQAWAEQFLQRYQRVLSHLQSSATRPVVGLQALAN